MASSSNPSLLARISAQLNVMKRTREALEEWESNSRTLNILITGKAGTGKSTLVNALIGTRVAAEGHSLDSKTSEVTCYETQIGDVEIKVWDSPGLQDGTGDEERYRRSIEENCTEIDLMIYCIQMSETRLSIEDVNAMIKLTKTLDAFGSVGLWAHSIIALTFANEVVGMAEETVDTLNEQNAFYFEKVQMWRDSLKHHLVSDLRLAPTFVEKMVIVPAGWLQEPELPDSDSDTTKSYWLSELWLKALAKTRLDAQPALLKINTHRMKTIPKQYDCKKHKTREQLLDDMPLYFSAKAGQWGKSKFKALGMIIGETLGYGYGVARSFVVLIEVAKEANKVSDEEFLQN